MPPSLLPHRMSDHRFRAKATHRPGFTGLSYEFCCSCGQHFGCTWGGTDRAAAEARHAKHVAERTGR